MSKLALIVTVAGMITGTPAGSQTAVPDLRGTWKGESETIILGTGNAHHGFTSSPAPRLDKQEGRRFSGTLSSSRGTEMVIAVISQSGTTYMVDDDGYGVSTMLAPNRLEVLLPFAVTNLACRFLHRVHQAALEPVYRLRLEPRKAARPFLRNLFVEDACIGVAQSTAKDVQ
jgi:hypothetical protein